MKQNIIAVMPAYNEAVRIGPVIDRVKRYVQEIIVIDDHSKDATADVARKHGAFVVRLITNMGAGFATRIGCDMAMEQGADLIVTIDADGQHDPAEIHKLVKTLQEKRCDIVYGSRPPRKPMPMLKQLSNKCGSFLISRMFGTAIRDTQTGFHAFTREAYPRLRWHSNRYGMVSEFVMRTGLNKLRYEEVEVKTIYTDKEGGMKFRDGFKALTRMIWWRMKE
ncbi:glycosyltransferase family 2 protein [Candidatus Woesearchaeota archaeon]|nr:glycosyltransferase family 2 protein [Candidatus Woesearchaeota archaeon]